MMSGQNSKTNHLRTVSAAFIDSILYAAEQLGLDRDALISQLNISLDMLDQPTKRLPESVMHQLFAQIHTKSQKSEIGLEIGRLSRPGTYNALGYAAMSCSNLWEAFQLIPRYESIVLEMGNTRVEKRENQLLLIWGTSSPDDVSQILADTIMASWLTLARWLTGKNISPSLTQFSYQTPHNICHYTNFFGSPVEFNCSENAFVFNEESILMSPILHADSAMAEIMQKRAEQIKAQIGPQTYTTNKVEAELTKHLPRGKFSLKYIAQALNMSDRTLRRKLQDEGSNFQAILSQVRHKLALKYLSDMSLNILDISLLLGYNEHSSFSAAFKNWQGETPQAYRINTNSQQQNASSS